MRRLLPLSTGIVVVAIPLSCVSGRGLDLHGPSYEIGAGDGGVTPRDGSAEAGDARAGSPPDASASFDAGAPVTTDAGSDAAPLDDAAIDSAAAVDGATAVDSGFDGGAPPDASGTAEAGPDASSCTKTVAILGGSSSSLFGAVAAFGQPFSVQSNAGSVTSVPGLVPLSGGYQGLVTLSGDAGGGAALVSLSFGGVWSAPVPVGSGASALGAPSLAVLGSTLQAVYLSPQHLFFHATFQSSWDQAADPVRPPTDASTQAFGPVAPASAATLADFVMAYEGDNQLPYVQTWTPNLGWDNGVALGSAVVATNTPLAIVALTGGGANDMLSAYVDGETSVPANNTRLFASLRTASGKMWSQPTMVNGNAFTTLPPVLTAMSGGRALLAWQGASAGTGMYCSVYTPGSSPAWSAPSQITSMSGQLSVAPGICGDDAEAVLVSNGALYTLHFVGGSWTPPALLPGVATTTFATIATTP